MIKEEDESGKKTKRKKKTSEVNCGIDKGMDGEDIEQKLKKKKKKY